MLISVHISNLENQAEEYQAVTVTFGICYFKTQSYIKLHKHLLQMICALNRKEGAHLFLIFLSNVLIAIWHRKKKEGGIKLKCSLPVNGWSGKRQLLFRKSVYVKRSRQKLHRITQSFSFYHIKTKSTVEIFNRRLHRSSNESTNILHAPSSKRRMEIFLLS